MLMLLSVTLLPWAVTATITNPPPADLPCPTSLDVSVPDGGRQTCPNHDMGLSFAYGDTMRALHSIMSACSTITDINLRFSRFDCAGLPDRENFPFSQAGGDVFLSRPHTLSLDGYDFGASEWDRSRPPGMTPDANPANPLYHSRPPYRGLHRGWRNWIYWLTSGKSLQWLQLRTLPDAQRTKTNLDLWLDAMDFSAVRNLTLRNIKPNGSAVLVSSLASGQLPALKVLSVSRLWGFDFLHALPGGSLTHLSWRFSNFANMIIYQEEDDNSHEDNDDDERGGNHFDDLEACGCRGETGEDPDIALREIWIRHGGPQLQELEFRGGESISPFTREVLPVSHLRAIAAAAPNLRKLIIDLDRKGGIWPEKELKALATEFPALESLSLYVEMASDCARWQAESTFYQDQDHMEYLEMRKREEQWSPPSCSGDDRFMKPLVNEMTVAEVFTYLRRLNVISGGGQLTTLTMTAGDWSQPWDGPMDGSNWFGGKRVRVTCWIQTTEGAGEETVHCKSED